MSTEYEVIIKPLITEKSNLVLIGNKYTFEVKKTASKIDIKKAVEKIYSVKVVDVNTITLNGKSRRYGRVTGKTGDWKKAMITLKAGDKIEEFVA